MIPITKPMMDEREAEAARRAILSGWVSQGPEVAAFEREFAEFVGAPHACAVSSCTTALHLALLAVGVQPGDEVITVSHSYIATANAIRYCGAVPVFVDIDPATFNLDPAHIENAVTGRTRAVLCVHQMGMPCDLAGILQAAGRHALPVVEDAACAIGSEVLWDGRWEKIGKPHGDVACFSFHPRKVISTGDGGMLTTANADWDRQFRLLRQHGMSVPDTVRHGSREVIFESYPMLGFNYRMTDIQAAVGREQLKRLPEIVEAPAQPRRALPGTARRCPGPCASSRTRECADQLAELLRSPSREMRSTSGDAAPAGWRHRHAPRNHVQPSRTGLQRRTPTLSAAPVRGRPGPLHLIAPLSSNEHG